MATLEQDLYNAFAKATLDAQTAQGKTVSEQTGDDGNIGELAKDIATSIIDWMLKQTFTITEMKATTELESLKTIAPGAIESMVLPGINVVTAGGPGSTVAPGNALTKPIDLSKGMMMTFGHTYIGRPAMKIKDADTADQWNDYTKVKLDPYKLKDPGTQQYPVSDRETEEEKEAVELIAPTARFVEDQSFGLWVELDDISIPGDGLLDSSKNVWDTGDGNPSNQPTIGNAPLQYTYAASGTYPVKLTVTDTNGLSHEYEKDVTVTDFESPVASFDTTVNDLFVFFTDTSVPGSGVIMSWVWSFGDDSGTSTAHHPTYVYTEAGSYQVTLTVTDQYGKTGTAETSISVGE